MGGNALTWQVDVETPSPSRMSSERSTQEGPDHTGYAVCASYEASVDRSFFEWHCVGTDDLSSGKDASRAQSSNCSPYYQCGRLRGGSANERANFEHSESRQEHPFNAELSVEFAKEKLKGASGE